MKRMLVHIMGGLGKQIASTAFLKAWKEQNQGGALHVVSPYPDVFRLLPFVDRTYPAGQPIPYFRDEHRLFEIFSQEPYHRLPFRCGEEHIVEAYCRAAGTVPPLDMAGVIRLSEQEHQAAMNMTSQIDRSKRWVGFQPWGGTSFYDPGSAGDVLKPKQIRDLPPDIAQGIVDRLTEAGCIVLQFSLPTERKLDKTITFDLGKQTDGRPNVMHPRVMFAILNLCEGFIGIDSSLQHAWAALRKPKNRSVVFWGGTNPKNFSYPLHQDIYIDACPTPHCGRPDMALGDVMDGNNTWVCPHSGACMAHNAEPVIMEFVKKLGPVFMPPPRLPANNPPIALPSPSPVEVQAAIP